MKTEQVKITQVKINKENPRTITSGKLNKLINSILVFPKMLELRPVVVDKIMKSLGGNMRILALREIAKMEPSEIAERLSALDDFSKKTKGEKDVLIEYWGRWLDNPTVTIVKASNLSEDERKQFIIKDNVSFGQWDYDALANNWDSAKLVDWGVDVWNVNHTTFEPTASNDEGDPLSELDDALPPELQNLDLTPDDLPKIEGDDETAMERIIIVYPKEREQDVANLVGLTTIDKVVYQIDEIFSNV